MAFVSPLPVGSQRSFGDPISDRAVLYRLPIRPRSVGRAAGAAPVMRSTLGVGVIGCGRIGQVHASTIRSTEGCELVMVADPFASAGQGVAGRFGCEWVEEWEQLVEDPRVQAVVVGSPTVFHAEQVIRCAREGKDVFCEKPLSNELSVVDECLREVDKADVRLMVGFQRRFDANFRRVRNLVSAGAVGTVRMFHVVSRDPAPPPKQYLETSGGIFLDMASHDFDMVRFVTGSEIESIYVTGKAFESVVESVGDLDTVIMLVKMKDGSFGTIDLSRRCGYGYDQRIEVFGSNGSVTGGNRSPDTIVLSDKSGIKAGLPYSFFMDRYKLAYGEAMKAFINMINEKTPPPASGLDGRASIVAGMAAALSRREKREVRLSEIDSLVSV